jgi:NADH-quinone oxidoreductase subunit N
VFGTLVSQLPIRLPAISYQAIAPEIILFGAALVVLALSATIGRRERPEIYRGIGLLAAAGEVAWSANLLRLVDKHGPSLAIAGAISNDGFSAVVAIIVGVALFLTMLIGPGFVESVAGRGPEFATLLLISATGAVVMAQANDLIVIFLGLEILSIALYIMVGFRLRDGLSREAAFKYFILGGFSSAVFLYGVALVYGATGSTNLIKIGAFLSSHVLINNGVLLFGIALILVGFGFKISAVPFHVWSPDVYQGAPTSVTGYMAAMAKIAAFASLLRVLTVAFHLQLDYWRPIVIALAILSLFFGAVFALRQREIKRMLAYSSINHAGFILLGVLAATSGGVRDSLFYLAAYSVMVIGTFGLISLVQLDLNKTEGGLSLGDVRGLGRRRPAVAVLLAILVLAQAGAPFTSGFIAKFSVITAVISVNEYWIAVVAMVTAAIAVAFYLRLVLALFARDDAEVGAGDALYPAVVRGGSDEGRRLSRASLVPIWIGIWASVAITVFFGVFPTLLLNLVGKGKIFY